jgi:hypothetical protein
MPHHLLAPVRYVGTHGSQPFHGRGDLGCFAVFGCIDDLALLIQILHTFLGKRGPDGVAGQVFKICVGVIIISILYFVPFLMPDFCEIDPQENIE